MAWPRWPDIDPKWWLRLGLVAVLVVFFVLFTRASIIAFTPKESRLQRIDEAARTRPAPAAPSPAP